jgi:hypothetical protein
LDLIINLREELVYFEVALLFVIRHFFLGGLSGFIDIAFGLSYLMEFAATGLLMFLPYKNRLGESANTYTSHL